ncbi:MAG: flavodoxin family protein [Coriobacteriales bacterium]|nr:flavodoxin family protein [Coriobacteriales bacterium]
MKVLMINGSPHPKGCIATALDIVAEELSAAGVEYEIVQVGNKDVRGCIACGTCSKMGKCVFDDIVNECQPKLAEADGIIIGSPVYYGNPNGTVLSFMQRLFYSTTVDLRMKVGTSIVSCRRGGNSASFEALNQFFGISGMPTVPSTYWNDVHGFTADDVYADEEGVQTVRNLARNMVFMMRSIADGAEAYGIPERNKVVFTHFIR